MSGNIQIDYPEFLANSLRLSDKEFENEIKSISIVKLFELGKISSGVAARVLGLTRLDFFDLLAKYNVSIFGAYDIIDLNEDIANA